MKKILKDQKLSILLIFLTSLIFLYLIKTHDWRYFIGTSEKIFMDYSANIQWIKCNYLNYDIYKTNSCFPNKATYGPAIFFLPFSSGLENFYLNFFPFLSIFVFLIASILIVNPKNMSQSFIVFICLVNPSIFLLIERLNFDIFVFLALLFIVYNRLHLINWGIILFLGLTKIYPFVLGANIFIENLKREKKKIVYLIMGFLLLASLYFFTYLDEYQHVITSKSTKAGLHFLFSIKSISKILKYLFDINYIISLPIILIGFFYFLKKLISSLINENFDTKIEIGDPETKMFFLSGLMIFLCFLILSNYVYREVFFIATLPFLLKNQINNNNKIIKYSIYLLISKFLFSYIYSFYNTYESVYYVSDIRFYSKTFITVSFIKGLVDLFLVSLITSIMFVMLKRYLNNFDLSKIK